MKELDWINCVRAVCILLVYFAHCVAINGFGIPEPLYWLYDPVYVNAFFFVSGYLFFGKQLCPSVIEDDRRNYLNGAGRDLLSGILFRLVIPAVIFSFIEYWPKRIIRGDSTNLVSFLTETLGGGTYWFVSALAVAQLLFFLMLLTRCRNIWFYVACSVILVLIAMSVESSGLTIIKEDPTFPWKYKQGMICTLFMAAGGVYGKYENYFGLSVKMLAVFACVYLTGSIWHTDFLSGHSSYNCDVQPLGFIWSMIGIITLIEICKRMPRSGFLTFIGRNSILFYFLSGAIPTVVSIVMQRFSVITSVSMLLIYVISVTLAFFLARFIVSFFPFLKDVRNMGIKK